MSDRRVKRNQPQRLPIIVIVGPTAAGKSALAVRLAKRFGGEVVSADSRQIYRGLEIGSGRIGRRAMRGVPHHLLGIASPYRPCSVAEFQRLAHAAIRAVAARGKLPILVGGSGFWVEAVARGLRLPAVPPDTALRKHLAAKGPASLLSLLRRLDPARARTVEPKNPRRIIRAIEIASALGRVPALKRRPPYRALWIGLDPSDTALHRGIRAFARRIAPGGLAAETRNLLRRGIARARIREFGFEYGAALDYLAGTISRRELRSRLVRDLSRYAQRQLAWFRRNPEIHWMERPRRAFRLVRRYLAR